MATSGAWEGLAHARLLAEEDDELLVWRSLAITMSVIAMLAFAACGALGLAAYQRRGPASACGRAGRCCEPPEASDGAASVKKQSEKPGQEAVQPSPCATAPLDITEVLRGILEQELSRALQREGIRDCLERLARKEIAPAQKEPPLLARQRADSSLRASTMTLQKVLRKRDRQTQELQRQLRECEQSLAQRTLESRVATQKLHDLLTDPALAPAAQAEEVQELRQRIDELSGRLADARFAQRHWYHVARQQRAFFVQTEGLELGDLRCLRRHPAGELFLAAPPARLEADEREPRGQPWDVGTAKVNPYVCDSWTFEPNVLARRASRAPSLDCLEEEEVDGPTEEPDARRARSKRGSGHGAEAGEGPAPVSAVNLKEDAPPPPPNLAPPPSYAASRATLPGEVPVDAVP